MMRPVVGYCGWLNPKDGRPIIGPNLTFLCILLWNLQDHLGLLGEARCPVFTMCKMYAHLKHQEKPVEVQLSCGRSPPVSAYLGSCFLEQLLLPCFNQISQHLGKNIKGRVYGLFFFTILIGDCVSS